jgi:hypothetical protein
MAPNQALERAVTTASQLHEASVPVAQRRALCAQKLDISLSPTLKTALDNDTINDTIINMAKIDYILAQMKQNPRDVGFNDLCKVCDHFFGEPRQSGSSHRIYKTPWQGDPRINIQNHKGKAKAYQVKQVLLAIERLEVDHGSEK